MHRQQAPVCRGELLPPRADEKWLGTLSSVRPARLLRPRFCAWPTALSASPAARCWRHHDPGPPGLVQTLPACMGQGWVGTAAGGQGPCALLCPEQLHVAQPVPGPRSLVSGRKGQGAAAGVGAASPGPAHPPQGPRGAAGWALGHPVPREAAPALARRSLGRAVPCRAVRGAGPGAAPGCGGILAARQPRSGRQGQRGARLRRRPRAAADVTAPGAQSHAARGARGLLCCGMTPLHAARRGER